jgi:ABC-type nitrate/sulfonate/bicarbonate transport system permease component
LKVRLPRAIGLLPMIGLLVAWQLAAAAGIYSVVLLPPPLDVLATFANDPGQILQNLSASLSRVIAGVGLATVTAVPAGMLIGRYSVLDRLTDWSIQVFRSFPPIALIPLAILFFGIGDKPAIILIFLSAFWPLLINTIFGVRSVDGTLLRVARAARASEAMIFLDVMLPSAMPAILTGLRLAVGSGWLTVVTAEMIAVKSGLGYMILNAQMTFRSDLIIAGIVVIGAVGLLGDQGIRLLRGRLCGWQEGLTASPV